MIPAGTAVRSVVISCPVANIRVKDLATKVYAVLAKSRSTVAATVEKSSGEWLVAIGEMRSQVLRLGIPTEQQLLSAGKVILLVQTSAKGPLIAGNTSARNCVIRKTSSHRIALDRRMLCLVVRVTKHRLRKSLT